MIEMLKKYSWFSESGRRPVRPILPALLIVLLCTLVPGAARVFPEGMPDNPQPGIFTDSAADIYERVSPAVVGISAKSVNPYKMTNRIEQVLGSGFIFDSAGFILTNAHVVYGRHSIRVRLADGTTLPAQLAGADLIFDIAVLRVPRLPGRTLPAVTLGDSTNLRVGNDVLTIGNPFGLSLTMTRGIVSAINRIMPISPFLPPRSLIQVDAPINPGNSGGPLINLNGEVIGITTSVLSYAENIGFVVPINLVRQFLPSILENGRVIRPWLGFHGQFITENMQKVLGPAFRGTVGFLVEVIEPGCPAEKAGLKSGTYEVVIDGSEIMIGGDIITEVNGYPLNTPSKVDEIVKMMTVGARVELTVFRNNAFQKIAFTLVERPVLPWDMPGSFSFSSAGENGSQ